MQDYPILSVTIDKTITDPTCMIVGVVTKDEELLIINEFFGKEAEALWDILVGGDCEIN